MKFGDKLYFAGLTSPHEVTVTKAGRRYLHTEFGVIDRLTLRTEEGNQAYLTGKEAWDAMTRDRTWARLCRVFSKSTGQKDRLTLDQLQRIHAIVAEIKP